jgi:hypothetical protein
MPGKKQGEAPRIYPTDVEARELRRFRAGKKPNQALLDKALRQMSLGVHSRDIIRSLMNEDGMSQSTAYSYLRRAYAVMAEMAAEDRPHLRNITNMRLEKAMQLAASRKDSRALVAANAEFAKINGLYAAQAVDVKMGATFSVEQMTSDEKRKQLQAILSKVSPGPTNGANGAGHNGSNGTSGH